jgi:hypothetical protein
MKTKLAILTVLLVAALKAAGPSPPPSGQVTFEWVNGDPASTNKVFLLYSSPDITIPMTNWSRLAVIPGTLTNLTTTIQPGQWFFVLTESNLFWRVESDFSNVASTPPLPVPPKSYTIRVGP